jgi:hypothetical protein
MQRELQAATTSVVQHLLRSTCSFLRVRLVTCPLRGFTIRRIGSFLPQPASAISGWELLLRTYPPKRDFSDAMFKARRVAIGATHPIGTLGPPTPPIEVEEMTRPEEVRRTAESPLGLSESLVWELIGPAPTPRHPGSAAERSMATSSRTRRIQRRSLNPMLCDFPLP